MQPSSSTPVIQARGVTKRFGHVEALRGVNFSAHAGEIVALVGDNGAGKSTLVKVLSGALSPDEGEVLIDGETATMQSPIDARSQGVETVYQDLALAKELSPSANLFLGREIRRPGLWGRLGFLDHKAMVKQAGRTFEEMSVNVRLDASSVGMMSGGQQQGIAVCRAVMWASRVVFFDEPTAALGVAQTANVLNLLRQVRDRGVAVVLITHNMSDVLDVADTVEVLRLGESVARWPIAEVDGDRLVGAMTGTWQRSES